MSVPFKLAFFLVLFVALVVLPMQVQSQTTKEKYSRILVDLSKYSIKQLNELGVETDHTHMQGTFLCTTASVHIQNTLKKNNIAYTVDVEDLQKQFEQSLEFQQPYKVENYLQEYSSIPKNFTLGSWAGYYTLSEIYSQFDSMKFKYPALVSNPVEIGRSVENRPIFAFRIGADSSKPKALYTALHHAREPGGASMLIYFLWHLLEGNLSNSESQYVLKNRMLWVIPCVNPDGYEYNRTTAPLGGGMWRKNRKKNSDGTFGVDLNRNYGPFSSWNATNGGSSEDTKSDTYRGTEPFSEPETKAIKQFCEQQKFVISHNYHTYGNLLINPVATEPNEIRDSTLYRGLESEMTTNSLYSMGKDIQTVGYSVRGDSDTWMYVDTTSRQKIISLTSEAGTVVDGFWAAKNRIIPICIENLKANYMIARSAGVNVRPVLWKQKNSLSMDTTFVQVQFQNIGLSKIDDGKIQASIGDTDYDLVSNNSEINVSLPSSQSLVKEFTIASKNINKSGKRIPLVIKFTIDGLVEIDTLWFQPNTTSTVSMYSKKQDSEQFSLGNWSTVFSPDLQREILVDSKSGLYPNNATNNLVFSAPFNLSEFADATLQFETQWSLDAQGDFFVVQYSTDFGATWSNLESKRMKTGLGGNGSMQIKGSKGFAGNYPLWTSQECSLKQVLVDNLFLRFSLQSNANAQFDGAKISEISMRLYSKPILSVNQRDIQEIHQIVISKTTVLSLIPETQEVKIFNLLGEEIINSNGTTLSIESLTSGTYVVAVSHKNKVNYKTFVKY